MTDLARNGSVLVAEIKAVHPPQDVSNGDAAAAHTNGVVPQTGVANGDATTYANGEAHGSAIHPQGSVVGTATDGGVAPAIDSSLTTPPTHSGFSNGHAAEASALSAGTGAIAVNQHAHHEADSSVATGFTAPVANETAAVPAAGDVPATTAAAAAPAAAEGASAPGLVQPQTTPIQPIQPGAAAREPSHINTAVPAAAAPGSAVGSTIEPTSAVSAGAPGSAISAQQAQPQQTQQLAAVAPAAAAAGAAGAGAGAAAGTQPVVAHPAPTSLAANEPPKSALSPKEVKKMDKLMKKEAKNEHKSIKRAIKDAESSEKLFRKSRDAETQAIKRHQKAQTKEHKAAKALSKAKAEYEKYAAELAKAVEDLDIKKRHTESTRVGHETAKKHIDELRNQKTVNDQARSRQAAAIHGGRA
ncbi:related to DNA binding protein Ncp1 [Ustilago trichophora]|uniref:Related to DNA binding protein Ncp1 n=1 Tax=Ustilago trichophora TaxID=86804 RepID=A0A5C3EJL4_9BASI|nr:related to DNA binding protein Ncp1 [Ustilago trichophora]